MQRALTQLLEAQERAVISRLRGKRGRQMVKRLPRIESSYIFDFGHWQEETYRRTRCWYEMVFVLAMSRVPWDLLRQLDIHEIDKTIDEFAGRLAARLTRATNRRIFDSIRSGVGANCSIDDLENRMVQVFRDPTWAMTVAQVETDHAYLEARAAASAHIKSSSHRIVTDQP
jgi:hypothetical protein